MRIFKCANQLHSARALCTLALFFIRRQVALAKVHPCTELGVASSKFTFTGGPHVKTASSPLVRAAGTPQERPPPPMDFKLVQYACDVRVSDLWCPPCDLWGCSKILVDLYAAARATCHVPPADPRPAPSSFRRFGTSTGATPAPIGPAVRALCPEMLEHTDRQTDKHYPANFFSATHRRKSSVIRTCNAKALAPCILYDFGLEAGIAKRCLRAKIVDIAIFRFGSGLNFTTNPPFASYQFTSLPACTCACARFTPTPCVVHHRIERVEFDQCPNFCIARSKFPEI